MWSTLVGGHLMKVVNLTGFTVLQMLFHKIQPSSKTRNMQIYRKRISESLSKTKSCRSTLCQQSMTDYSIYIYIYIHTHSHPPYLEVISSSQNLRVCHDMVLR